MELITNAILNLGIGATVVAACVYYLPRVVLKLQEQRENDLTWARQEIDLKRREYLTSMEKAHAGYLSALDKLTATIDRNEERHREVIEGIQTVIAELAKEMRALRDEIRGMRPLPAKLEQG